MPTISPGSFEPHRENIAAADSGIPLATNAAWLRNPGGYTKARVYAYVTLTGGTSPYVVLRPYIRNGGGAGKVGKGEAITVTGTDQVAIDVDLDGDDLLVWLESITGSPTTTDVDLYVSWR